MIKWFFFLFLIPTICHAEYIVTFSIDKDHAQELYDTNIPVLIYEDNDSNDDIPDAFYSLCESDGSDIHFTDVAGNELTFELVDIDITNQYLEVYVNTHDSGIVITSFLMKFGGESSYSSSTDLWDSFSMVHHLETPIYATLPDSTTNNNDATPLGSMDNDDVVTGKIGKCLDFDGSDDGCRVAYDLSLYQTEMTLAFWYYNDSGYGASNVGMIHMYNNYDGSSDRMWLMYLDGKVGDDDLFGFNTSSDGSNFAGLLDNPQEVPTSGQWSHITITVNNTTKEWKLYTDGTLEQTDTATYAYTNQESFLEFGKYISGSFDGKLDEVTMYQGVLDADQITALYNQQNTPSSMYEASAMYYDDTVSVDDKQLIGNSITGTGSISFDTGRTIVDPDILHSASIHGYINEVQLEMASSGTYTFTVYTIEDDGTNFKIYDSYQFSSALYSSSTITLSIPRGLAVNREHYLGIYCNTGTIETNTSDSATQPYYIANEVTGDTLQSAWTQTGTNEVPCVIGKCTSLPQIEILGIGDSIMEGHPNHHSICHEGESGPYAQQSLYWYARNMNLVLNWQNMGWGSDTFNGNGSYPTSPGTAYRMERDAFRLNPKYVFIHCGTNDLYTRTWNDIETDLDYINTLSASYPSVRICLAEILPRNRTGGDQSAFNTLIQTTNTNYASYCTANGWTLLECYDDFYDSEDEALQDTTLFEDGAHPNEAGYNVLGDAYYVSFEYDRSSVKRIIFINR